MSLKVLGICGGAGLILHPMRERIIGNIEPRAIFVTPGHAQWKLNFRVPFDSSVVEYSHHQANVIVGAPDCGHSSVFAYSRAKKLGDASENKSLNFFIDGVAHYKPKMFMMENLPKLTEVVNIEEAFPDYNLINFVASVSAWGNSQVTRVRLVVVGIHKDYPLELLNSITLPESSTLKLKTEAELLKGLGASNNIELGHVREPDDWSICLIYNGQKKITVKKARELWNTKYVDLKKWPANYGNMVNQPGVYRNFAHDYPLTVRKQNRQFNSQGYMLSPREMARIQGVPDTFKLWMDEKSLMYCVNKARVAMAKTPPYEIGTWFNSVLNKLDPKLI